MKQDAIDNDDLVPPTVRLPVAPPDFAAERSRKRLLLGKLQENATSSAAISQAPPTPEELLPNWPTDARNDPDFASFLFKDFCQRRAVNLGIRIEDYQERFPEHKESLARLVQQHELIRSLGGSGNPGGELRLPEVGERLFGFALHHELGHGSFARVFLATQQELANRLVVLKISNLEGEEPQMLAQLQHTNIVPIHSVHEDRRAGLRAVCMPYFGGASLSAVNKSLPNDQVRSTTGEQLVGALAAAQEPAREVAAKLGLTQPNLSERQTLALLSGYNFVQANTWIIARLAEGLQHSHDRGVLHRDIKPSNVLLSSDGQPMLLDFNLSQVQQTDEGVRALLGGTISYMAPEHLRALADRDPILAQQVDHRADIYALGIVLFELLAGKSPFGQSASYTPMPQLVEAMAAERTRITPSLRVIRPDVPWGLESIVRHCLAPDPNKRYQQAGHLADDLQRLLEDRPLRYAPELSIQERWQKWARRHPRLTSSGLVGIVALLLLTTVSVALSLSQELLAETRENLSGTQEQLEKVRSQDLLRAFEAGTVRALCLVNTTTDGQNELPQGVGACAETLSLFQILERNDWQQQPAWKHLAPEDRQRLAEDARELILLLAWAKVQAAPKDKTEIRKALNLLERAQAIEGLGPLRALWEDRANYLQRIGEVEQERLSRAEAARLPLATARDYYLLALTLARKGDYTDAVVQLNKALKRNPSHYWSRAQLGICYKEMGEPFLAITQLARCVGLQEDFAWGHYNLGCLLDQVGKRETAIEDYTTALRLDPGFAMAYLNRGLALLDLKRFQPALEDFDRAAVLGQDDAILHGGRGEALEGLKQPSQAEISYEKMRDRANLLPAKLRESLLLRHGFAVYRRLPQRAQDAFEDVLRQQPNHPQALYGKAMILVEKKQESDALACFDRALKYHPSFTDARRFRAVLLARQGDLAGAGAEINRCLEKEPDAGITLYAAACVLALAAEKSQDQKTAKQWGDEAISLLQKAFAQGYGRASAATDPDLRAVQSRRDFQQLLRRSP